MDVLDGKILVCPLNLSKEQADSFQSLVPVRGEWLHWPKKMEVDDENVRARISGPTIEVQASTCIFVFGDVPILQFAGHFGMN